MKATQTQLQLRNRKSINEKLDEIIKRLDILTEKVDEDLYPDESRFKASYIKRETGLDRKIKSGKTKLHTYKDFAELDRTLG